MSWLSLVLACLKVASTVMSWMQERQLIEAGAASEALRAMEQANAAVERAKATRHAVRAGLERDPDGLRKQDPFERGD